MPGVPLESHRRGNTSAAAAAEWAAGRAAAAAARGAADAAAKAVAAAAARVQSAMHSCKPPAALTIPYQGAALRSAAEQQALDVGLVVSKRDAAATHALALAPATALRAASAPAIALRAASPPRPLASPPVHAPIAAIHVPASRASPLSHSLPNL